MDYSCTNIFTISDVARHFGARGEKSKWPPITKRMNLENHNYWCL